MSGISPVHYTTPQAEATSANRWAYFWKGTAVITAVALLALLSSALIWSAFFYADYMLLATTSVSLCTLPTYYIAAAIWDRAEPYDRHARIASKQGIHWDKLTDTKLQAECKKYSISMTQDNKDHLKGGFSVIHYCDEKLKKTQEKLTTLRQSLHATSSTQGNLIIDGKTMSVKPSDFTLDKVSINNPIYKTLTKERKKLVKWERTLLSTKIGQAKFFQHLKSPEATPKNKVVLNTSKYTLRYLGNAFGDPAANADVIVKGENPKYYSRDEIMKKDMQTLAKELFSA